MENKIKSTIIVKEQKIEILRINDTDYISLTDLARYADNDEPRLPIQNWMRNKDVISYLGLWEKIHNQDFKRVEFDAFENEAGSHKFKISPKKWINEMVLFLNQVIMVVHLLTQILLLNLLVGYHLNSNYILFKNFKD